MTRHAPINSGSNTPAALTVSTPAAVTPPTITTALQTIAGISSEIQEAQKGVKIQKRVTVALSTAAAVVLAVVILAAVFKLNLFIPVIGSALFMMTAGPAAIAHSGLTQQQKDLEELNKELRAANAQRNRLLQQANQVAVPVVAIPTTSGEAATGAN